ncbi:response regulator transcription factor [Desertivirga xinjiangensis]|uniref:response regulator transcription factor n=1 Tax=Desertivirga xinjiangensis TaxID=539206 RepID=UPI00210D0B62|nr:helix-turn-helix transcriptional regulator [Pedobacter xinjiangensis]
MSTKYKTQNEITALTNRQLYSLENGLAKGHYSLQDIGELIPGAIMVHDMNALQVTYMNSWGCETLNHSMDEINAMGEKYYEKFFVEEESRWFLSGMQDYLNRNDQSELYSFFHQVRTGPKMKLAWHYAVCKLVQGTVSTGKPAELILIANPVSGMGFMVNKVNKLLDENIYIAKNYKKFVLLSKREKEVIRLLVEGMSSSEISDILFISRHTINTHRKNIYQKLDFNKFSELVRFANAFELRK